MSDMLVNKVAASGLITIKPEEWISGALPERFDLKDYLYMDLILKEQDFRERLKSLDWNMYRGKIVCLYCSADAIIPNWAYMLVASNVSGLVQELYYGTVDQWINEQLLKYIDQMDITSLKDQRVIVKGCSDHIVLSPEVYVSITSRLVPVVKSLMFGEPCSTVPVFKRSKSD